MAARRRVAGPSCYCGKTGCIETFLSGPGLAREFRIRTGKDLSASEISSAADAGDADAIAVMETYEDRLARGLAHVINIVDPDVIVLGGGLSNIERLYRNVPALIQRYVFSDGVETPIVRADAWRFERRPRRGMAVARVGEATPCPRADTSPRRRRGMR